MGDAREEPELHRLWRLRQGLRDARFVNAAATEAFGPPGPGREELVLQFLHSTRFLEALHKDGRDMGPTLSNREGAFSRLKRSLFGASPDEGSYRGEVTTGTFV